MIKMDKTGLLLLREGCKVIATALLGSSAVGLFFESAPLHLVVIGTSSSVLIGAFAFKIDKARQQL